MSTIVLFTSNDTMAYIEPYPHANGKQTRHA